MKKIDKALLNEIIGYAEKAYPNECCGLVMESSEDGSLTKLRPCQNVQDSYHALDAETFPRTARTAYFIAPAELLAIQKEMRASAEKIRMIYHSHPDGTAAFSKEDTLLAAPESIPAYPGVAYLVVSVKEGAADEWKLFEWNESGKLFTETEGAVIS